MNNRFRFDRTDIEQIRFFEKQLFEAKQALFVANSVRKVKFLQSKIDYLKKRIKELGK